MRLPPGYASEESGNRLFVFRAELREAVLGAGLQEPRTWGSLLTREGHERGSAVRLEAALGSGWMLKQMKRGGLAAPFWRERHWGRERLLANLLLPIEVARRGVPTALPVALLVVEGPAGLYRGWLASEEIAGAVDLRKRLGIEPPPGEEEMRSVLTVVRKMHDAGIEHRDLNLGNVLVKSSRSGEVFPFVVDFDRAVLHPRPLDFPARQTSLRRLERSYLKWFGAEGPLRALGPSFWYTLYAGPDERLVRLFDRGRPVGRTLLAVHGLGWRRRSRGD